MVAFKQTMGGYEVLINDEPFGFINRERGFFTDPTVVKSFMTVNIADFEMIVWKIRKVQNLDDSR